MLINLNVLICPRWLFLRINAHAVRTSLHSLVECQYLNGLSFVKAPPLSRGSPFHEIGAFEYRNDMFSMDY